VQIPNSLWGPIQLDSLGENIAKEMGNYQCLRKGGLFGPILRKPIDPFASH